MWLYSNTLYNASTGTKGLFQPRVFIVGDLTLWLQKDDDYISYASISQWTNNTGKVFDNMTYHKVSVTQ